MGGNVGASSCSNTDFMNIGMICYLEDCRVEELLKGFNYLRL